MLKYSIWRNLNSEAIFVNSVPFPVIDPVATGENILRLRRERGLTVRDLQAYFGFEEPQAIYKWQRGKSLPSVDNLYALGALLKVPIEEILVPKLYTISFGQQAEACCPPYCRKRSHQRPGIRRNTGAAQTILQRLKSLFCQGQPFFWAPRLSEGGPKTKDGDVSWKGGWRIAVLSVFTVLRRGQRETMPVASLSRQA